MLLASNLSLKVTWFKVVIGLYPSERTNGSGVFVGSGLGVMSRAEAGVCGNVSRGDLASHAPKSGPRTKAPAAVSKYLLSTLSWYDTLFVS